MAELLPSSVIDGVVEVQPVVHGDDRGAFIETYRRSWFPTQREMIQGNRAERVAGSIVGLHYHLHQSDYWYVIRGHARVVLHDLRQGSPTDGATLMLDLQRPLPAWFRPLDAAVQALWGLHPARRGGLARLIELDAARNG